MPGAVCRMLTLLRTLVVACPIGMNLGLLHLLWMLASGRRWGGAKVRPLARTHKRRTIPATPPDRVETWREDALLRRAEVWADLVRPAAAADGPTITELAIHDPRHREPLLLAASLSLAPRVTATATAGRWINSP